MYDHRLFSRCGDFFKEPNFENLLEKINTAETGAIGAPTLVECGIVLSARLHQDARGLLARFLEEANISRIPFTDAHYSIAVGAWLTFGKGRHPAGLSFGDCCAYAIARLAEMPLLFTGDDFSKTDIPAA